MRSLRRSAKPMRSSPPLPEGGPQAAELNTRREALTAELDAAKQELESAQLNRSSLEDAKNRQDEAQAKNDAIDKKIAGENSGSLQNAIDLAMLDVDAAQRRPDQLQAIKDDPYLYASTDGVILSLDAAPGAGDKDGISRCHDRRPKYENTHRSRLPVGHRQNRRRTGCGFMLDAFGDQKFTGRVQSRSLVPIKDSNPVSYNVTISVDQTTLKCWTV